MENIIIMLNIKKLHVLNDRILLTIMKGNTVGDWKSHIKFLLYMIYELWLLGYGKIMNETYILITLKKYLIKFELHHKFAYF